MSSYTQQDFHFRGLHGKTREAVSGGGGAPTPMLLTDWYCCGLVCCQRGKWGKAFLYKPTGKMVIAHCIATTLRLKLVI